MFYVFHPTSTSVRPSSQDAHVEQKRQEYLAAVAEQRNRRDFERAVAEENARHRATLDAIASQRQLEESRFYTPTTRSAPFTCGARRTGPSPGDVHARQEAVRRHLAQELFDTPETHSPMPHAEQGRSTYDATDLEQFLGRIFGQAHDADTLAARNVAQPKPKAPETMNSNPNRGPNATSSSNPSQGRSERSEAEPHWTDAPKRAQSLATISSIAHSFNTLRRTFTFPTAVLDRLSGSDLPRLAFNPTNAPVHAYENALSDLLTKLDSVESYGFKGVREARKEVVRNIEKELEDLERKVAEALGAAASPVTQNIPVPHIETSDVDPIEVDEQEVANHPVHIDSPAEDVEVNGYDLSEEPSSALPNNINDVTEEVLQHSVSEVVNSMPGDSVSAIPNNYTAKFQEPSDLTPSITTERVPGNITASPVPSDHEDTVKVGSESTEEATTIDSDMEDVSGHASDREFEIL